MRFILSLLACLFTDLLGVLAGLWILCLSHVTSSMSHFSYSMRHVSYTMRHVSYSIRLGRFVDTVMLDVYHNEHVLTCLFTAWSLDRFVDTVMLDVVGVYMTYIYHIEHVPCSMCLVY